MRVFVLLMTLVVAGAVEGATRFLYEIESTGDALKPRQTGTIIVEGDSYRVTHEQDLSMTATVSTDGGVSETNVHDGLRTWYDEDDEDRPTSRMLQVPLAPVYPTTMKLKSVEVREEETEEILEGMPLRKWVLRFAYEAKTDFGSEVVRSLFSGTAVFLTTDGIDLNVVPIDPRKINTGVADIDAALERELKVIEGFPLHAVLSISRRVGRGTPYTDVITTTFRDFETTEAGSDTFAVPADYIHQEPIVAGPGR